MKNIYVIPTDKPSKLWFNLKGKLVVDTVNCLYEDIQCQNIYITSDEEIKGGDWCLWLSQNKLIKSEDNSLRDRQDMVKKIILTTDQDLIKDGVQAIDDEFLEWFVKNPSCEGVETIYEPKNYLDTKQGWEYVIIIPKEEPNIISNWLEQNRNPEIDKQVDEEAKKLQKQHLINMMKQDEELGLYDEQLRKQFPANVEGSKEFNDMCKEEPKERLKKILGTKHPKQEIPFEDIFNEEKKKGVKELIDKHKQETLEEALNKFVRTMLLDQSVYIDFLQCAEFGAKWQQERMYSEEEVIAFGEFIFKHSLLTHTRGVKSLFEQFKKK